MGRSNKIVLQYLKTTFGEMDLSSILYMCRVIESEYLRKTMSWLWKH
ncbi:unannotated protein [freshwater metagenome]|uniref:Unannotated protein n=1 Tax=freshwater metagenome TaxID=449393 RepID=A0A6J6XI96_9ZZZZ